MIIRYLSRNWNFTLSLVCAACAASAPGREDTTRKIRDCSKRQHRVEGQHRVERQHRAGMKRIGSIMTLSSAARSKLFSGSPHQNIPPPEGECPAKEVLPVSVFCILRRMLFYICSLQSRSSPPKSSKKLTPWRNPIQCRRAYENDLPSRVQGQPLHRFGRNKPKNAQADRSILWQRRIDFVGPGQNAAGQVGCVLEAGLAQEIDGFGAARPALAMHDDFAA